jgi:hypothetical protein
LLDVVDAVVEAAVVEAFELEVDGADEVELVDAGAADELDGEETEAELDVVGLTTAVAAPGQGELAFWSERLRGNGRMRKLKLQIKMPSV